MICVAIVDDEEAVRSYLEEMIQRYLKNHEIEGTVMSFGRAETFLYELDENRINAVFLDIEMPEVSGLEAAKIIRSKKKNCEIIFFTSHAEYALEGYEYQAFRFLDKLGEEEKIYQALDDLWGKFKERMYYEVDTREQFQRIYYDEIYELKKEGKYVCISTANGVVRIRRALDKVLAEMDYPGILQVDRGCAVNMDHVVACSGDALLMRNRCEIAVSHNRLRDVRVRIAGYRRKHDG